MAKEKGRQWDGRSRPPSELYKKNFDEIFKKKKEPKKLSKEDQEYLDSLKKKL